MVSSKQTGALSIVFVCIAGAVLVAMTIGLLWQQTVIRDLQTTQLPQTRYVSYEDCINNGGVLLNTINVQLSACLGGNDDTNGEIPQYQAFLQYSAQNLPRISDSERTDTANTVIADGNYSADLIEFLKYDATGCEERGIYEIVKEVPSRYALMYYGCDTGVELGQDAAIIAMKLSDGWRLLSPTNNMDQSTPSCLLADVFKISKELSATCFENTGYNNGTIRDVLYR